MADGEWHRAFSLLLSAICPLPQCFYRQPNAGATSFTNVSITWAQ